jgi:hypothetical protein
VAFASVLRAVTLEVVCAATFVTSTLVLGAVTFEVVCAATCIASTRVVPIAVVVIIVVVVIVAAAIVIVVGLIVANTPIKIRRQSRYKLATTSAT